MKSTVLRPLTTSIAIATSTDTEINFYIFIIYAKKRGISSLSSLNCFLVFMYPFSDFFYQLFIKSRQIIRLT